MKAAACQIQEVLRPTVSMQDTLSIHYSEFDDLLRREIRFGSNKYQSFVSPDGRSNRRSGDAEASYDESWLRASQKPAVFMPRGKLRVADLFCGSGGLTLGAWEAARALQLEIEPVFAVDNDEDAINVYRNNFAPTFSSAEPIEGIVTGEFGAPLSQVEREFLSSLEGPDLVLAGPPCQGHSDLNNHTRRRDPRNALIERVVRFVELAEPTHVIIENVQGIRHDRSGSFQRARNNLLSLGYEVADFLLEAQRLGVPQKRRRCFLVGSRNSTPDPNRVLDAYSLEPRTFDWACSDLDAAETEGIFNSSARVYPDNQRRMEFLLENDIYDLPDSERPDCHRLKKHDYRSVYGRLYGDRPAPTITTGFGSPGQGRFTHPRFARTLTPHEAARLQFFPDFFQFGIEKRKRLQKLIGNAVPPKLSFALALDLLAHGK